jgi:hypothetical protein
MSLAANNIVRGRTKYRSPELIRKFLSSVIQLLIFNHALLGLPIFPRVAPWAVICRPFRPFPLCLGMSHISRLTSHVSRLLNPSLFTHHFFPLTSSVIQHPSLLTGYFQRSHGYGLPFFPRAVSWAVIYRSFRPLPLCFSTCQYLNFYSSLLILNF